jgi:hypothetical protein
MKVDDFFPSPGDVAVHQPNEEGQEEKLPELRHCCTHIIQGNLVSFSQMLHVLFPCQHSTYSATQIRQ